MRDSMRNVTRLGATVQVTQRTDGPDTNAPDPRKRTSRKTPKTHALTFYIHTRALASHYAHSRVVAVPLTYFLLASSIQSRPPRLVTNHPERE